MISRKMLGVLMTACLAAAILITLDMDVVKHISWPTTVKADEGGGAFVMYDGRPVHELRCDRAGQQQPDLMCWMDNDGILHITITMPPEKQKEAAPVPGVHTPANTTDTFQGKTIAGPTIVQSGRNNVIGSGNVVINDTGCLDDTVPVPPLPTDGIGTRRCGKKQE